jgi:hypothetical protein
MTNPVAAKLQVRADATMNAARATYEQEMREVMYKVAFNLQDAVDEINRLQAELDAVKSRVIPLRIK